VAVNASAVSAPVAKDEMLLLRVATDTNVEVPVLLAVLGHAVSATIEGPGRERLYGLCTCCEG